MNPTALLLSCIAVLNVSLGLYVYRRNPSEPSHRAFAVMATMIGVWTLGIGGAHYSPFANTFALRIAFAAASLIPIGVLSFVENTPTPTHFANRWKRFFIPIAVLLCIASFSPLIVVSVTSGVNSSVTKYGPLHPIFASFVVVSFIYSVYILFMKHHGSTGLTRVHTRHLIFAFAIPCALATLTNLAAPLFLKTSSLSKYGPFFTLPLLALIGHSIIRHRLLNVRVVVRKSVVYLASFCCAGIVLIALLSLSNAVIHEDHGIPLRETILCFAVAICFTPFKEKIRLAFDRYLYREPYDYQRTVREASQSLRTTINLITILDHVVTIVDRTLKPESLAVYLLEEDGGAFHIAKSLPGVTFPEALEVSSALIASVVNSSQITFRDEVLSVESPVRDLLALEFDRLNADVIVPLIEESDVIALLCLGQKRSGDPYFSDDADLLATLANQSSVAIRNAQTHQRVVQLNEELQTILSTIESGVVAVGAKARVTLFNRTAERLIGVPASSAKGQRVEDLPPALARCLGGTLADGEPRSQVEFSLPDPAGQLVPLVCSTSALVTPSGQLVGAVAAVNDISHLKELEHEKRRAERLASIDAIASGLVHEIRNPLVAVKTFSQLLPTKYNDPEFRETFSRTAGREIRRIDNLLTRFRTLVSASSQPIESVDITDPIRHTLDLLRPQFDEHQIRVRQVWDGTPRPILGNTSQLEQLFLNLCLNAMEAMGAGGELTLRVADLSDGGGTTLLVEVSDTGTGIPEELLAKIFDPFVSTKARGSGLGLAICRGVADAHRARLRARNNSERSGSTFTIEFPVPIVDPSRAKAT